MKKLTIILAACVAIIGCSVTKVEYEKNDKGEISYRIYHNEHWLKREAEGLRGGMTNDGKFEIGLDASKASPSEEFNKTMQTYTSAVVSLAQIAAAAYNPSSSAALMTAQQPATLVAPTVQVTTNAAPAAAAAPAQSATTNSAVCVDGSCTVGGACTDGSCTDTVTPTNVPSATAP